MAPFNPNTGAQSTGTQTGVSRGAEPNRSFEALFSGLGDAIDAGVNTADTFVQNKIEDDARYGFDALNEEVVMTAGQIPPELTQSSEGLHRLAQAHSAGKITQEYYSQRLAAQLKGLRTKYPGYEKEVDNIVQSVTGVRPANAFRDALFANMEASNRALASSADNFQKWTMQDGNMGYIQQAFPDYFDNPEKYAGQEQAVIGGVAKLKGAEQNWTSQKMSFEGNKQFADVALNQRLGQITSSMLEGSSHALGMSGQTFMQKLNEFTKKGGMSPEEKAAFTNQYEQFLFSARAKMTQDTADLVGSGLFTSQEMEAKYTASLQPLIQIRDLIANDQYDQAAMLVARNNNMQNQARAALYKSDPNLLGVDALSKIAPAASEFLMQDIMASQGGTQDYFTNVAITDQMASIIAGDDTLNAVSTRIIDNKSATPQDKNKQAGDIVKKFTGTIRSGTLDAPALTDMVTKNYPVQEGDIFSKVSTEVDSNGNSQYLRLYNEMFNPEITKQIVSSGSPEALRAYTQASVDRFQSIPEFRKAAADLGENIDYGKFLRARYDEGTNRLVLEIDQDSIDKMGFFSRADNRGFVNRAVKAKDALNTALSIVAPIIEANGGDEAEGINTLIRNMAIDLEPDDRGGFFNWINTQLDKGLANLQEGASKDSVVGSAARGAVEGAGNFVEAVRESTSSFRDNLQETERSLGQPSDGMSTSEAGGLRTVTPDPVDAVRGATQDFRENLQETEEGLGAETGGRGALNYAPASLGSSEALNAIERQTNFKEIGLQETAALPQGDISWLVPEAKNLGDAASGPYTGNVDKFSGKTNPVEIASSFSGLNEREHKNVIANFIKEASGININPATTAWCAAFVNGVLGASGSKGTGKLNARSFLNWGQPVDDPKEGDVVVFSRGNSGWQGHVGFYMGTEERNGQTMIKVLGGNQGNKVKESYYPASRLLGYRRA